MNPSASELNARGNQLHEAGRIDEAIVAYRQAIEADPTWDVPWYNLGLMHKNRGDWARSFEHNLRATELADRDDVDTWWNLGIAATALGNWTEARRAWRRCGIDVPDGEGPVTMALGMVPIRLDPRGRAEVVWCDRIDPARAVIRNVPLPWSAHEWGDVILHDGAPNGQRRLGDRTVPVFDALTTLQPSTYRSFALTLVGASDEDLDALEPIARARDAGAENWSRSIRYLCRQCSEGLPHEQHDADLEHERHGLGIGVAARSERHLVEVLEAWRHATGSVAPASWEPVRREGRDGVRQDARA